MWPAPAPAADRVALVIGMSAYRHSGALPNPVNDARDVAVALAETGFEVSEAIDLDKAALDMMLRAFARRSAQAGTALVFFAGHGMQVSGVNYLLPVDAQLESERDLELQTLRLDVILHLLTAGREQAFSIVILDACRDNPLARTLARSMGARSTAVAAGLAPVHAGAGTFIAFSTQPGSVALDGPGPNSPFARALLRHLRTPGLGIGAMMMQVRRDVIAATRNTQVPWDHSALTSEFYFVPTTGPITGALPKSPSRPGDRRQEHIRRLHEELGLPAVPR
jgi:uncharacterized caspase-like protein